MTTISKTDRACAAACLLVAGVTIVPSASSAKAETETFDGEYVISYLGFTVARSTFHSTFEGGKFKIDGSVSSAGIAQIFDRTKGISTSSGIIDGDGTRPSAFRMDYTEGKRKQMTAIRFQDGRVIGTVNDPPLKKRGPDWVPLDDSHLIGVTDPLSAGIVRASSPDKVCARTVKIYDGEFRLDATLSPAPPDKAFPGYGDQSVTCQVQVRPVAGYRKGRKALDYLQNRSRIMVAFTPLGTTGLYAPVHATIGTQIGTVTVKARNVNAGQ
jgi:hypothetical protein